MGFPFDLIASDFDLTLASYPGGVMGPRTAAGLREARRRGAHVAVISGRSTQGLKNNLLRHDIDVEDIYVSGFNGAEITQGWDGKILASRRLPAGLTEVVMAEADTLPIEALVPHGTEIYTTRPGGVLAQMEARSNDTEISPITSWSELQIEPHKVLLGGRRKDLEIAVSHLRDALEGEIEVTFSAPELAEVNAKGVSKGSALDALREHLGVRRERSLSFGDNENDISLIQAAGVGVAVANAIEELKAVADRVTASVEEDGVGLLLDEYFLQELS